MNKEHNEKRLMEAFAQYESGVSLATLQTVFSDVAVELNQMVEAEQALKQGKEAMRPEAGLGRKIVAALAQQQRLSESSLFMSKLWRFAAPVGVAALSLMFILVSRHTVQPETIVVSEQAADAFATQEAAPMMAKNAPLSFMAIEIPQSESSNERTANSDNAAELPGDASLDRLYLWQMISLGLLVALSIILLLKHVAARRRLMVK